MGLNDNRKHKIDKTIMKINYHSESQNFFGGNKQINLRKKTKKTNTFLEDQALEEWNTHNSVAATG